MKKIERSFDIRLHHEGTVIVGTFSAVNQGKRKRPVWQETLRWRCPCGADIDTATMPSELFTDVTGGYVLNCPGCGRPYMHHCALGYVEG